MNKTIIRGGESILVGAESVQYYRKEGYPDRVLFDRNCTTGLPVGSLPIFDIKPLEGYYDVVEEYEIEI